jgi:hypothetical protein
VLRHAKVERFVDLTVGIGQGDLELSHRRGPRHRAHRTLIVRKALACDADARFQRRGQPDGLDPRRSSSFLKPNFCIAPLAPPTILRAGSNSSVVASAPIDAIRLSGRNTQEGTNASSNPSGFVDRGDQRGRHHLDLVAAGVRAERRRRVVVQRR